MKTKHCPRCDKDKPLDQFYTYPSNPYCKPCTRKYFNSWLKKKREERINDLRN